LDVGLVVGAAAGAGVVVGAAAGAGLALEADLGAGAAGVAVDGAAAGVVADASEAGGVAAGAGVALEDFGGAAAGDCAREPVARRSRQRRTTALLTRAIANAAEGGNGEDCGSDGRAAGRVWHAGDN
jgi:hypothetical protein